MKPINTTKSKIIPIVFAINDNYVRQLCTVIASILKNGSNNNYEFNILSKDISKTNTNTLKKFVSDLSNNKSLLNVIDMKLYIKMTDLEKYMSKREGYTYISVETYFRFFIPEIFQTYKKVLYLDADILVLDDLGKLFNEDISQYSAAVVQDLYMDYLIDEGKEKTKTQPNKNFRQYIHDILNKSDERYFNAGVLLLNLAKIRKENIVEKLWRFVIEKSPLEFQDQDVLNAVLDNDVKYVDYRWNTLKDTIFFASQLKDFRKNHYFAYLAICPSIFHYVGENKPWTLQDGKNMYNFIIEWWDYYKMTPYYKPEESTVLEQSLLRQKSYNYSKTYISFKIFDFVLFEIKREQGRIFFKMLNFIKLRRKLKYPKFKITQNIINA